MALLVAANQALIGLLLPWVMGQQVSPGARHVQRFFMFQAAAWGAMLTLSQGSAMRPWHLFLECSAAILAVAGLWHLAQSLQCWLGPRPLRQPMLALGMAGIGSFAWHWSDHAQQWAWFSLFYGLAVLCVALMCLRPRKASSRGWRWLLYACCLTIACDLLTRSAWFWAPDAHTLRSAWSWQPAFALLSLCSNTLILAATLIAWREESGHQLQAQAMTDQLTNLPNRRALLQAAPRMLEHAQRHRLPLALVLLDLDHFKHINDNYGHAVGDQALQLFAQVLQQQVRSDEVVARWGGEEFCLLMHADAQAVSHFFERLQRVLHVRTLQELGFALDLSAGASLLDVHPASLHSLMVQADTALYRAKGNGRGCLVFAHQLQPRATGEVPSAPATHADMPASLGGQAPPAPHHTTH